MSASDLPVSPTPNDASRSAAAPTRVIVGMSGGVDSSVAAHLLIQQGYQVEGLFMKNWDEDDGTEYCTAKQDLADAESVCQRLGIKLHTANFAAEYWDNVFEYFLAEYKAGRTPNPDILCNREIKFKVFLEYAEMLGADAIATGHYARRCDKDRRTYLLKGLDGNKDQSYFLHAVGEAEFARSLFPLGELEKPEVRRIAEENGFITSGKKDSTGICFIGERRFKDFLEQYLPAQPGDMQTPDGEVMGQHSGLMYHTIGQRQGLGIGGVKGAGDQPWYVVGKDLARNVLLVAQGKHHPLLYSTGLTATQAHWINGAPPATHFRAAAKTRYRQADQACEITVGDGGELTIAFAEPQRAVTPGQSVVIYQGDVCLGGAVIDAATGVGEVDPDNYLKHSANKHSAKGSHS
ncbi:tRNA 2-thiouridine(34) synthase MnmA [Microbulbifer sp. Q7]|uniref:tRNA 2-thiouridine(34) synthase MnmA n=1 Tax=Microbulbifer sp. Q7 TaxID=1785091 RepID=UPI0009ED2F05